MPVCRRGENKVLYLGQFKFTRDKGIDDMLIKKSEVPSGRDSSGKPKVRFGANGQIAMNKQATEAIGTKVRKIALDWDVDTRTLTITGIENEKKLPKGLTAEDLFGCSYSETVESLYFGGAGVLKAIEYNYKDAGNQGFEAEVDPKTHVVTVVIPANPTPKPTTHRVKKAVEGVEKATAVAAKSGNGSNGGGVKLEDVE